MLFLVTQATLNQKQKALLNSAADEDIIVLAQNGVYLLCHWTGTRAPVMAVAADCRARGIETTGIHTVSYAQWVSVSEQHQQWVTI